MNRRDYEASMTDKILWFSRRRMTARRHDIIVGARLEGNAYRPVSGITSARPPFAPDDPDDEDAN